MASRSIERRIDAAKHRHVTQDSLSSNVPPANLVPKLQARLSSDPSISPQDPQQTTEVQPSLRRPAAETPQKATSKASPLPIRHRSNAWRSLFPYSPEKQSR